MTNEQALQWFRFKFDRAKDYYDEHWDATERREHKEYVEAMNCTIKALTDNAELKAADVQPVVHAYWIELPKALDPNENPCKCSHCKHILSFVNCYPKSNYCPNCGARMEGDVECHDTK